MSDIILHNNIIIMIKRIWHLSNDRLFMIQFTIQKIISAIFNRCNDPVNNLVMEHFVWNISSTFEINWQKGLDALPALTSPYRPLSVRETLVSISLSKIKLTDLCIGQTDFKMRKLEDPGKAS